jgi:hypothetical protein
MHLYVHVYVRSGERERERLLCWLHQSYSVCAFQLSSPPCAWPDLMVLSSGLNNIIITAAAARAQRIETERMKRKGLLRLLHNAII